MVSPVTSNGSDSLTRRVEILERRIRRMYAVMFVILTLVLVLGAASATLAQQKALTFRDRYGSLTISGSEISFRDPKGNPVMRFYIADTAQPVMRLNDSNGRARLFFGLTGEHQVPRLSFQDTGGTERLYVGLSTENTGMLRTFTSSGKAQTSLEDTFLRIRDSSGVEQTVLGVSTANEPVLKLFDSNHQERLFAGIYTSGDSGISVYNANGTTTWSSP